MQRHLDEHIEQEHPLAPGEDRFAEKVLALQVEMAELANETRCFKYWSNKPSSDQETILEEYVDGVHFLLSIGNDIGVTELIIQKDCVMDTMAKTFSKLMANAEIMVTSKEMMPQFIQSDWKALFSMYIGLGEVYLGFTWEQIERAYIEKNQVNHERQENGY
ncbi:dUTP diphosphatase [Desertibacillus haloalkaliphilus]|nr:dUTP diphosphatase [Desertibacillus haloalkaliphilus]